MADNDLLILEGIVTTLNESGELNASPMGPIVDREITSLHLRPFHTSRTYRNLKRSGEGVFHITDDVELFARTVVGGFDGQLSTRPAAEIAGKVLANACRWFEFRVTSLNDEQERTDIRAQIVATGAERPFFGFNRAKHAVVEAAILVSRLHILPQAEIDEQLAKLRIWVEKTGGVQERTSFEFLTEHVARYYQKQQEHSGTHEADHSR